MQWKQISLRTKQIDLQIVANYATEHRHIIVISWIFHTVNVGSRLLLWAYVCPVYDVRLTTCDEAIVKSGVQIGFLNGEFEQEISNQTRTVLDSVYSKYWSIR